MTNDSSEEVVVINNQSCLSLIQQDTSLQSGYYDLTTGQFYCDMNSNGGGWVKINANELTSYPTAVNLVAGLYDIGDGFINVYNTSAETGNDATFTFTLPFFYSEFKIPTYSVKDISATGHTFDIYESGVNLPWNENSEQINTSGDIMFGSIDTLKPITSYYNENHFYSSSGSFYPFASSAIYSLGLSSNKFSIRAYDSGGENERVSINHSCYFLFC